MLLNADTYKGIMTMVESNNASLNDTTPAIIHSDSVLLNFAKIYFKY